jgi:hypothetical protein
MYFARKRQTHTHAALAQSAHSMYHAYIPMCAFECMRVHAHMLMYRTQTLLTGTVPHQGVALLMCASTHTHTHTQLGLHENTDSQLSTQIRTENPWTHTLLRLLGLKGEHQIDMQ